MAYQQKWLGVHGKGEVSEEAQGDIVNCPSRLDKTGKQGLVVPGSPYPTPKGWVW